MPTAASSSYAPADGLPGERVPAIAQGLDSSLWMGTDGGLVRFRKPRFTVYTQRDGLASDFVGSIFQDVEGSVWVETGRGLTRFVNGAFKPLTTRRRPAGRSVAAWPLGADGLPAGYTRRPCSLAARPLRPGRRTSRDPVGSRQRPPRGSLRHALVRHPRRRADARSRRPRHSPGERRRARRRFRAALFEDRQGSLWVGTLRNGVTRISNGQMTSWSTRDGLAANHVKAFYQDAAGTLWIGTHGGGLSRFKDGRFATISARQGLYNDDIFQILEDDDANLWMNCNTGIWRTSMRQLNDVADGRRASVESFAYGTADGMLSSEGVGANLAGWKMRDGSLWFPTIKGIVAIDPRRRDTEPPRVADRRHHRRPRANRDRRTGSPDSRPGKPRNSIHRPELEPAAGDQVQISAHGLDRDWVDAGSRRTAYYSHLPPGSYTFTVTADNGEGVWNATGQTLAIVVLPRFYQTWWFRAAVASSLVALVWLSWRYRIAQMRRAQAAQQAFSRQLIESQERERQRIAAELHDSLGQNLLVVKNRALLGALSQPDEEARKQFDEIGATAAQTLEEVRAISYNLRPHHLDQLGLTTTIRAMIEKIAESSGDRHHQRARRYRWRVPAGGRDSRSTGSSRRA